MRGPTAASRTACTATAAKKTKRLMEHDARKCAKMARRMKTNVLPAARNIPKKTDAIACIPEVTKTMYAVRAAIFESMIVEEGTGSAPRIRPSRRSMARLCQVSAVKPADAIIEIPR
jgi:hypothetical protein